MVTQESRSKHWKWLGWWQVDEPILSCRGEKLEGGYLILPKHMLITNKQCVKLDKSQVKKILAQILNKEEALDNVLD